MLKYLNGFSYVQRLPLSGRHASLTRDRQQMYMNITNSASVSRLLRKAIFSYNFIFQRIYISCNKPVNNVLFFREPIMLGQFGPFDHVKKFETLFKDVSISNIPSHNLVSDCINPLLNIPTCLLMSTPPRFILHLNVIIFEYLIYFLITMR